MFLPLSLNLLPVPTRRTPAYYTLLLTILHNKINCVRFALRTMPYKCGVPGCKSNYDSKQPDRPVTVFSFPKDPTRAETWLREIRRSDYRINKFSRVCIKHFDKRYIVREDSVTRPHGPVLTISWNCLAMPYRTYLVTCRKYHLDKEITLNNGSRRLKNEQKNIRMSRYI